MTNIPLAERLRPKSLDDYIGQTHLVGPDGIIRRMIETGRVNSFILWGPPGVGKTTLARIIASQTDVPFYTLSAVTSGVKEVREILARCEADAAACLSREDQFFSSMKSIGSTNLSRIHYWGLWKRHSHSHRRHNGESIIRSDSPSSFQSSGIHSHAAGTGGSGKST